MKNDHSYDVGNAVTHLSKAGAAEAVYALHGRLYLSDSGYLLLSVPNAVVRGAFDALAEPGVELPLRDGRLNAHVTVMRPEEVESIGAGKITERGHFAGYQLGALRCCDPDGWPEMSKVWFLSVKSPDLEKVRKSYGLSPQPKHPFHLTVAVRRKHVLRDNEISKVPDKAACAVAKLAAALSGGCGPAAVLARLFEYKKTQRAPGAAAPAPLLTGTGSGPASGNQDNHVGDVRSGSAGGDYAPLDYFLDPDPAVFFVP